MTTPTTPAKPERPTDLEVDRILIADDLEAIDTEIRRARAHEEDEWTLADALAHEVGLQIEARLELELANARLARERDLAIEAHNDATAERDEAQAAQREAELQRDYARAALEIASKARDAAQAESAGRLKALEEKAEEARREWKRAENAEAERDAAREEAERLKSKLASTCTRLAAVLGDAEKAVDHANE